MDKQLPVPSRWNPAQEPINYMQKRIADWLKKVHFKRKLFGGVSEADVWKKLEELNRMYTAALVAERVRYETLLEQRESGIVVEMKDDGGV